MSEFRFTLCKFFWQWYVDITPYIRDWSGSTVNDDSCT